MVELEFTGERYVPGLNWPEISYEHWHRYLYAMEFASAKVVLDIASGEGYGSALLAQVAERVIGVDVDAAAVQFASRKYCQPNLEFRRGPAHAIPVDEEHAFDLVVCFETIEHLSEEHQRQFLHEIKRLLKPGGVLLLSTPNKQLYSDEPAYTNQFHVNELYQAECSQFLRQFFDVVTVFGQKVYPVSYIWPLNAAPQPISEHQLVFSQGRFWQVKGDEKELLYMLAACSDLDHTVNRGSVLLDLSHRTTGVLHEQIAGKDQAIQEAQSQLADALEEHASRAQKATDALADREATIRNLEGALTERTSGVEQALQTIAERDATIQRLQTSLTEQAAGEDRLKADIDHCVKKIQELQRFSELETERAQRLAEELRQRDETITELNTTIADRNDLVDRGVQELATREARIRDLHTELEERCSLVSGLTEEVRQREADLRELRATLDERAAWASRLAESLAERDTTIGRLKARLQPDGERVRAARADARALDVRVTSEVRRLQAVLDERVGRIERLTEEATARESLMREFYRDLGDRSAWVLRWVDTFLGRAVIQSAAAAADGGPSQVAPAGMPPAAIDSGDLRPQLDEHAGPREDALKEVAEDAAATQNLRGEVGRLETALSEAQSELERTQGTLNAEQRARLRLERTASEAYVHLKRRIADAIDRLVPARSTVLVVSKGDEDLLRLTGRSAWHFPQTDTGVYAGHYPADAAAAIDHLELVRAKGAHFLLFPATSCWWLDHYSQFGEHLTHRYRQIFRRDDVGVVFDLRRARAAESDWNADLLKTIEEFQDRVRRNPAILDCDTGLDVASGFPQHTVFSPSTADSVLPYLDATIDVVVCGTWSPRAGEARRVAKTVLLTAAPASGRRRQGTPGVVRLHAGWLEQGSAETPPSVSIIIPCHNGTTLTESCLMSLDATLPPYFRGEVIVVDDASTDGTQAMLARRAKWDKRVRVIRNRRNIGFLRSCNRAGNAAKGNMLVFLNNDALPRPGWLAALLRTFRDRQDAGAVGGKLLYRDGRLQEAGGVVFSDGSGANFGKGDLRPDDPLYSFVREVDYCSGALLATTRSLFKELGGFDTRYCPAYYEDTDFCFKVRARGYKVYYQPDCQIVHCEGASSGNDLSTGIKRYQTVNREKFVARWHAALETQPPAPDHYDRGTWHDLAYRSEFVGVAK